MNETDGTVEVGIRNLAIFTNKVKVIGTLGEMEYTNFIAPFTYHTITLRKKREEAESRFASTARFKVYDDGRSTYDFQLVEFTSQIESWKAAGPGSKRGGIAHTKAGGTIDEPDETMRVIDEMYRRAGMKPRNDERGLMA